MGFSLFKSMFVDEVEITVKGGKGGDGCSAFLREKFRPKGGPAGGDGGRGGSVYAEVAPGLRTLVDFRSTRKIKADNGLPGEGKKKTGRSGEDIIIDVPPGTIIRDADTGEIIADLKKPRQRALLAQGPAKRRQEYTDRGYFHGASEGGRLSVHHPFAIGRAR